MLEFGLKRITTTVRGSGDWWLCVRVPVRVVFYFDLFIIIIIFFCFLTAVGNGSKRIEPQVGKVSIFKPRIGNL